LPRSTAVPDDHVPALGPPLPRPCLRPPSSAPFRVSVPELEGLLSCPVSWRPGRAAYPLVLRPSRHPPFRPDPPVAGRAWPPAGAIRPFVHAPGSGCFNLPAVAAAHCRPGRQARLAPQVRRPRCLPQAPKTPPPPGALFQREPGPDPLKRGGHSPFAGNPLRPLLAQCPFPEAVKWLPGVPLPPP